jgi:hypothetical protein
MSKGNSERDINQIDELQNHRSITSLEKERPIKKMRPVHVRGASQIMMREDKSDILNYPSGAEHITKTTRKQSFLN